MMASSSKYKLCLIGLVVLLADFSLKFWVNQSLPLMSHSSPFYPYGGIGIFHHFLGIEFSLTHHTNTGAAWGLFQNWPMLLLTSRIVLISVMAAFFIFAKLERFYYIPIILILSGAIGNIIDYFVYGHVIDMFHFVLWGYDFPVFNLADAFICVAVGWLVLLAFVTDETTITSQG